MYRIPFEKLTTKLRSVFWFCVQVLSLLLAGSPTSCWAENASWLELGSECDAGTRIWKLKYFNWKCFWCITLHGTHILTPHCTYRITFKRIIRKKSTEQFSCIPYVITLLNCLLSMWYGLPFVSPNNVLVVYVSSIGGVLEAIYVLIFLIFAPKKEKAKICGYLFVVLSIFSCLALVSLLAFHGNKRKLLCGFAFTVSCIMMYGSPLSVMRLVIKSKSVEYMPFFLSLSVFICSASWLIFGLLGKDPFILVPNGIGALLGAVQLILYAIYRDNRGGVKKDEMNESVEMRTGELQDKKLANPERYANDNP